jgi:hypothetical protein
MLGTAASFNAFTWDESDGRYAFVVAADIGVFARGAAGQPLVLVWWPFWFWSAAMLLHYLV